LRPKNIEIFEVRRLEKWGRIYARANALTAVTHKTTDCHFVIYVYNDNSVNHQVTTAADNLSGGECSL
jgi:hypothetical protein